MKVGNTSRFTDKLFQYVIDLDKVTKNMSPDYSVPHVKIYVNKMRLEVKDKSKEIEDMVKPIAPFCSKKIKTLGQEAKDLQ